MADDRPEFIPPPPRPERPLQARVNPLTPPPPPPPPTEPVVKRGLADWIGVRALRRPEPRLGVSLASAGAGMLVLGAIAVGGDQLLSDPGGDGSQFPGLLITFAVIAGGVLLTARYRNGPLAAAGVAASATALPPFLVFVTYSKTSPPSFDTILIVACVGWAAGYLVGPGRGHNFYVGASLLGLWLWFIEVTEHIFSFPTNFFFGLARAASAGTLDSSSSSSTFGLEGAPDSTTIAIYTLIFAAGYLVAAVLLDRRDMRGLGTPFTFTGIVTLIVGIATLGDDLEQIGTGFAFTLAGLLLLYLGATGGRRATNVVGAILVFGGITTIVADPFDTASSFGFAEIIAGGGVILLAHWVATQFREPPETEPVLSRFYNVGSTQPAGPPPPPAGSVLG
ncbi:MAG: hypothetical protein QOD92_3206 [Acidimicrobiaceae bacterium]|jgi:hypothetical protein